MAYTSCAARIAANIQQDCNRPLVGGYTGRAVIMSVLDFMRAEVVRSADNPRKILSVVLPPDGSVMAYTVDNVFSQPFAGSNTAGNTDNGRNGYLKTVSVRVPMRGADTSMQVVEPLVKNADGFVMILEKRDKVGDGSYEVIGYQNALRGDIAGVTRDESANGGDWIVPLTTVEKWAEVTLVGAAETYDSAKKEFEGLFGFEPIITRIIFSESQNQLILSANGLVIVESIQDSAKVRENYSALNRTIITINADSDTEVIIYGAVTEISNISESFQFLTLAIKEIDLSNNTALTQLYCISCTGLTSLDVSKNTALTNLYCINCTGLTSLDVSKNTALTELNCESCTELTSLDVSKNTALTNLNCDGCTGLTSLDLSKNTALTYLDCISCTGLMLLDIQNTASLVNGALANDTMTALKTIQLNGTSEWAQGKIGGWLEQYAPTGGMLYVNQETLQEVVVAAESKDWEVIYVS